MAKAVVLARGDQVAKNAPSDWVYGKALSNTWQWLSDQGGEVDLATGKLQLPDEETLANLVAPQKDAPQLLPDHLDALVAGSEQAPEVSLLLHGESSTADVYIAWRADLPELSNEQAVVGTVELVPPSQRELLPLPIYVARSWLRGDDV